MKRVIFLVLSAFKIVHCRNVDKATTRIVGGTLAEVGEFTGQISLQNEQGMHMCGGTMIDERSVLTAAHCYKPSDPIALAMGGDISISAANASAHRQSRPVAVLVIHPEFDESRLKNDLAYIRLHVPFNITKDFQPVRRSKKSPAVGDICTVVGWGYTENTENDEVSEDLLKVDVQVFGMDFCNSSSSYWNLMLDGMFCAGDTEGGKDSCQGDSGGLIQCEPNLMSGVVSFGDGCGLPNYPGVYTDISLPIFSEWIDEMLVVENFTQYFIDKEAAEAAATLSTLETTSNTTTPTDNTNSTAIDSNNGAGVVAINTHSLIMVSMCGVLCAMKFR